MSLELLKIVCFFVCISCAVGTLVNNCKTGVSEPIRVQINDCEEGPCPLIQGKDVIVNVTFDAFQDLETLKPEVVAKAIGLEVNYPLPEKEGCNSLIGSSCPIEEGERVMYQLRMPILSIYPPIAIELQFTLYTMQDDEKIPLVCFHVLGQVVKP